MNLSVKQIHVGFVAQYWPSVEKFIQAAIEFCHGDYTLDQVKVYLSKGEWILLVAVDDDNQIHGAMTALFNNYPNDRVAFVTFTGGKFVTNQNTFDQMSKIFKGYGATKIQVGSRESVARYLRRYGFKERYIIAEVKI
jgi:hypothetical protein